MKTHLGLPLVNAVFDPEQDESGMGKISLVNAPANKQVALKFSAQPIIKKLMFSEDRRLVTAVVMLPDFPMFRDMEGQQFYIQFPKETIEQMRDKYHEDLNLHEVNTEHGIDVDGVKMVESWIVDASRKISAPGDMDVPDGTWIVTFRVHNDKVWESVKDGTFQGVSLEGIFGLVHAFSQQNDTVDTLPPFLKTILDPQATFIDKVNALNSLKSQDVQKRESI